MVKVGFFSAYRNMLTSKSLIVSIAGSIDVDLTANSGMGAISSIRFYRGRSFNAFINNMRAVRAPHKLSMPQLSAYEMSKERTEPMVWSGSVISSCGV